MSFAKKLNELDDGFFDEIIDEMKSRIPKDERTKPYFDKLVADGVSEDEAIDIMITDWLRNI